MAITKWHRFGHYGCKNISRDADQDEIFVRLKDVEHLIPDEPPPPEKYTDHDTDHWGSKPEKAEVNEIKADEWVCKCGLKCTHIQGPGCIDLASASIPFAMGYDPNEPRLIGGEWWYPFKGYPK